MKKYGAGVETWLGAVLLVLMTLLGAPVSAWAQAVATTTTLATSTPIITVEDYIAFNVTVSGSNVAPSGFVSFYLDGTLWDGPFSFSSSETSFQWYSPLKLTLGLHSIMAVYQGDVNSAASPSEPITVMVTPVPDDIGLSWTDSSQIAGQQFALTSFFTKNFSRNGSLQFLVNGANVGNPIAVTGRTNTVSIVLPYPGNQISVAYSGDSNNPPSTSFNYTYAEGTCPSASILGTTRTGHSATLLTNGKVLIVGGNLNLVGVFYANGGIHLASAELYEPATNAWTAAAPMPGVRAGHTATLLANGKVLVTGGVGMGSTAIASAELYDPANDSWSPAAPLMVARTGHTATLLPSGKVLVTGGSAASNGGSYSNSTELYDPESNTWSYADNMRSTRANHTATLLANGLVLVTGGGVSSAELYDPAIGSWTAVASMATVRTNHTATLLANGQVLVAGNVTLYTVNNGQFTAELYDPHSDTWSAAGSPDMPRTTVTATLLPNGNVIFLGGGAFKGAPITSSLGWVYNVSTNTWSSVGSLAVARSGHTTTLLPGGALLVTGGYDNNHFHSIANSELFTQIHPSTTAVSAISTSATLGQSVSLVATITGATPGGTVLFLNNDINLGSATVQEDGVARLVTNGLTYGANSITATYSGDGYNAPSTSAAFVIQVPQFVSSIALSASPSAGLGLGQTVTASARLSAYSPLADVTFNINGVGKQAVVTNGVATTTFVTDTGQTNAITVTYPGDHFNLASTSAVLSLWVAQSASITMLSATPATGFAGQVVSITATVGGYYPSGLVQLVVNGINYGAPAGLSWSVVLPIGVNQLSAIYAGDANNLASASNTLTVQTVVPSSVASTARFNHAAALLSNGTVLVAGGYVAAGIFPSPPTATASAELYNPTTKAWSSAGMLATARGDFTLTRLANGKVLAVGGLNNGNPVASAELYDPVANTWSSAGAMAQARASHSATLLPNGKVLVVGGFYMSDFLYSAELYDPSTNTWGSAASLAYSRGYHTATLLANGKVLVAGGGNSQYPNGETYTELYSPATDSWSTLRVMLYPRYQHTSTLLPSGEVLVAGGQGSTANLSLLPYGMIYNPSTNFWARAGTLPTARYGHTASLLPNGDVLVAGGAHTADFQRYHRATNSWSTSGGMLQARSGHSATVLANNDILFSGGIDLLGNPLAEAEVFTPSTTALATSAPSVAAGTGLTLTATVTGTNPTGTVQFMDGDTALGSPVALTSGVAQWTLNSLTAGSHDISAVYSGDSGNLASTSATFAQTITQASASIRLTAAPTGAGASQLTVFTATVSGALPTGTVQFVLNGTNLGSAVTLVNGVATLSVSLPLGSNMIRAVYSGDGNNLAVTSASNTLNVVGADTDTPTLPEWAAILMGLLLLGCISQRHAQRRKNTGVGMSSGPR